MRSVADCIKALALAITGLIGGSYLAAVNKRRDAFGAFRQGDEDTSSFR